MLLELTLQEHAHYGSGETSTSNIDEQHQHQSNQQHRQYYCAKQSLAMSSSMQSDRNIVGRILAVPPCEVTVGVNDNGVVVVDARVRAQVLQYNKNVLKRLVSHKDFCKDAGVVAG
mmetsp:Transcript_14310/g.30353  ORF Transcript_14310/g.30353 Transcript_14310/m.30353 type:complete len:116 (+) Transcript_14310:1074-1421(+)